MQKECDFLLQHILEICASKMKKIGVLLVEGPYFGEMHYNEGTHMVAGPLGGSSLGPGLAVGGCSAPAARLPVKDCEKIDGANSEMVRDCEIVLGKEACSGRRVVGLAVVCC